MGGGYSWRGPCSLVRGWAGGGGAGGAGVRACGRAGVRRTSLLSESSTFSGLRSRCTCTRVGSVVGGGWG